MVAATDFKDYYEILGVSKNATPEDIKKSLSEIGTEISPGLKS